MECSSTGSPAAASPSPSRPHRAIRSAPAGLVDDTQVYRLNMSHQCVSDFTSQALAATGVVKAAAAYDVPGPEPAPPRTGSQRLAIRAGSRLIFLNPDDLLTVAAQGNYVLLQCVSERYRMRGSISVIAEKLKPYGFARVQRSLLVNKSWVEEIRSCPDGNHILRLRNSKEFIATRGYRRSLASLAELWV